MGKIGIPGTPNPHKDAPYQSTETRRGRAMLFQVTDPQNQPIFEYVLAMHMNPSSFEERFSKSRTTVMTYGGFLEWIWPDELDSISASASTGAFIGPDSGLTAGSDGSGALINGQSSRAGVTGRHGTIAWERQEDLLDLFKNNGVIFNGQGLPVLHGNVMCMYDRGIYVGHFTSFEVKEDDEHAYSFAISWEFKVRATVYKFPGAANVSTGGAPFKFLDQSSAAADKIARESAALSSSFAATAASTASAGMEAGRQAAEAAASAAAAEQAITSRAAAFRGGR